MVYEYGVLWLDGVQQRLTDARTKDILAAIEFELGGLQDTKGDLEERDIEGFKFYPDEEAGS